MAATACWHLANILGTEYTECQAFFPIVGVGSKGGRHIPLRGSGCGGPNSDEGTDALVLYVYYNPSTILRIFGLDYKIKSSQIISGDIYRQFYFFAVYRYEVVYRIRFLLKTRDTFNVVECGKGKSECLCFKRSCFR